MHDSANIPQDLAHLFEEIQAKDQSIHEHRTNINNRDLSIQKHVRNNGSLVPFPREEGLSKTISLNYTKALQLQDEKMVLSKKALDLLERQVRRFDVKIKELQTDGAIPNDSTIPTMLKTIKRPPSRPGPTASAPTTIRNSGVIPPSVTGRSSTIAELGLVNDLQPRSMDGTELQRPQSTNRQIQAIRQETRPHSPIIPLGRDNSAAGSDRKRQRLMGPSNLGSLKSARESSAGLRTPRAGTPTGSATGRPSSLGPKAGPLKRASMKRIGSPMQRKLAEKTVKAGQKKGKRGKRKGRSVASDEESGATPSEGGTGAGSEDELTPPLDASVTGEDVSMHGEDEDGADDRKYCVCKNVSFGNMVACDNGDCPIEWYHWGCVGITSSPVGKWYCDLCKIKGMVKGEE